MRRLMGFPLWCLFSAANIRRCFALQSLKRPERGVGGSFREVVQHLRGGSH